MIEQILAFIHDMVLRGRRIAVIGGTGLVGRAIVLELLREKPERVLIFARRDPRAMAAVRLLRAAAGKTPLTFVWGNLLREAVSVRPESTTLYKSLVRFRPSIVVDATNTATIHVGGPSIHRLRLYFDLLFRAFGELRQGNGAGTPAMYIKIGTTGTGGMGLNIPFSHHRVAENLLMEKAMLSGTQTAYLLLASRTPGMPVIKEIKPATGLFVPRVTYEGQLPGGMPVFDGGESGRYSIEEFATITDPHHMGFLPVETVATIVVGEIRGRRSGFDCIAQLNSGLVEPTRASQTLRDILLGKARALSGAADLESLATGALGPARVSALLVEAWMIRRVAATPAKLKQMSDTMLSQQALEYVITRGDFSKIMRGLHLRLLGGKDQRRGFAAVDLRPWRMGWWREQILAYTKKHSTNTLPYPGDIVSWVLYRESGGRKM